MKPSSNAAYFSMRIVQPTILNTSVSLDPAQLISEKTVTRKSGISPNKIKPEEHINNQLSILEAEPRYYKIKELDVKPEMIGEIDTKPAELAPYRQGGEIKIQIWIDERGNVVKSEAVDSNLPQVFIDYTIASFNHSKFTAGIKDGVPVHSVAKVVVQFASTN